MLATVTTATRTTTRTAARKATNKGMMRFVIPKVKVVPKEEVIEDSWEDLQELY